MEFLSIGVDLFHADGQTDMVKQIVAILRTRLKIFNLFKTLHITKHNISCL